MAAVVAVIVADLAIANSALALAGMSPSIQTKKSVRIAGEQADARPVATPESSRLEFLILDRHGVQSRAVVAAMPNLDELPDRLAGDGVVVVLIGTNDDGAVAAYDAKSGAQKWIWKGDGPAYASPVIVEIEGVKQVVTLTQKYAVGLALASGGNREGSTGTTRI